MLAIKVPTLKIGTAPARRQTYKDVKNANVTYVVTLAPTHALPNMNY